MGRGKHRAYPSKEYKDENEIVKELKDANRRLKSENQRLKSQIATLEEAFSKTSQYIKDNTDNVSVEKIINGVKQHKTLKQINDLGKCDKCSTVNLKSLPAGKAGTLIICSSCSHTKVLKDTLE